MPLADLRKIGSQAVAERASDIHLVADHPPALRIDGALTMLPLPLVSAATISGILKNIMSDDAAASFERCRTADFVVDFGGDVRARAHAYFTKGAPAIALRLIPQSIPSLAELSAPSILSELAGQTHGLILITGPAGCGKSTTLAAMIEHINHHYPKHVTTIEDPVEFIHPPGLSLITQKQVGSDATNFADGLRSCLREDPNVILIGELRDYETVRLALQAAETGHLVLGTLAAGTAPQAIDRFIDVFRGEERRLARGILANCLRAVVAQALIKRKDAKGRIAAFEVLISNAAVHNLIREGRTDQLVSAMQTGAGVGMQTLAVDIQRLIRQGLIAADAKEPLSGAVSLFNPESCRH